MRSGLAIEMRIWSKLCGPETCPKMFINSFIEDPSRTNRLAGAQHAPARHGGGQAALLTQLFAVGEQASVAALLQFDVEAKRAQLLDEDVERFGNARLEIVVAADDRLVDLGAAGDVIRLDSQHLLQSVGRAIGFERPHLHLAETLPAELRLAAQWLLGDQTVRTDRTSVDLVVDQMVQLQHVDVADRHLAVERLAGAAIDQDHLAGRGEPRPAEHRDDVVLARPVEHRAGHRHAARQLAGELDQLFRRERLDLAAVLAIVDLAEQPAQLLVVATAIAAHAVEHLPDPAAEPGGGPAEMGFEDLADIHPARHAQGVEHDVDRGPVFEIGHVLDRHDARDDALVAVTAGHLVARL